MGFRNVEDRRAYQRARYPEERDRRLAKAKLRNARNILNADWVARRTLRNRLTVYGLAESEWLLMVDRAGGRCECCSELFTGKVCIEHNHTTGKVRGLVCTRCNFAIGVVEDSELFGNVTRWVQDG